MIKTTNSSYKKTYVGFTNNLFLRLKKHNNNKGAKSTKGYKWELIFKKEFSNKNDALSYEYKLKKNRKQRSSILKDYNESVS